MEHLKIDFSNTSGKIKYMNAVNNGPYRPRGVVRTTDSNFESYKAAGISYARLHDASVYTQYDGEHLVDVHRIFKNFDADENDPESYIFEPTDIYLKAIEAAGTKTFYRLGASIEHRYKYGTRVPKDFGKWARICEHIIKHYTEGWADGFNMDIEYWEIWNEPDCDNPEDGSSPCWQGTLDEFIDFYCTTAKYLKEQFPHLKIGGPSIMSIWWKPDFAHNLLKAVKERNAPLDFFSFHWYGDTPEKLEQTIAEVKNLLDSHGFCDSELILNEWNYMHGWRGDVYKYSLEQQRSIKGASFISSAMSVSQADGLDMLMYYNARPGGFNGLFSRDFKILKGYYPFVMFKHLLELGTYVKTEYNKNNIYSCAATDGKNHAIMISHYNNDDDAPAKQVVLECKNPEKGKRIKVQCYVLDDNNDMELSREEFFTTDEFNIYLNMGLFTTYLIKFTAE